MSSTGFECSYDADGITMRARPDRLDQIRRLLTRRGPASLADTSDADESLAFALADVRALGDERPGSLEIVNDAIRMDHGLASALDSLTADALGLPPLVHLTLHTDAEGLLGSPSFRLRYEWNKNGKVQNPRRIGSILKTADGDRRIPNWLLRAIEVADAVEPGSMESDHWEALAQFRQTLDPGIDGSSDREAALVSMTDFLQGLGVRLADRFSLAPKETAEGMDFDIVPFSGDQIEDATGAGEPAQEAHAELEGPALIRFCQRVRERGALPAYRLGRGEYLVVDRSSRAALRIMAEKQRAGPAERAAFVRNPRPAITQAVEDHLRESGQLDGLSPEGEEEAIEAAADPLLVETLEYSARVIGKGEFIAPQIELPDAASTRWMPEGFSDDVVAELRRMDVADLESLCAATAAAIGSGGAVAIGDASVPATEATLRTFRGILAKREQRPVQSDPGQEQTKGPTILETKDNFDGLHWQPDRSPRTTGIAAEGLGIRSTPKVHQTEGLAWQISAWLAGLPGVLNADEQGLGKTLQTLAFMRWLKAHMDNLTVGPRHPMLVVAPTSLLRTWEAEAERHLDAPGLGVLLRLYGSGTAAYRRVGAAGTDTRTGEAKLDFRLLDEAIADGKGHRFWLLTTYTTLTNYQHSLARIPFAVAVFDEIQALKNPASLRSFAARAVQADFRIGLTGTPIENRSTDLWAVMDQLCPGALDSLQSFNRRYGKPDEGNMRDLHDRVFKPHGDLPPLAIRRTKDEVARDLPDKARRLHPRQMPRPQADAYAAARLKLGEGSTPGAALKVLHQIRAVSAHPSVSSFDGDEEFIAASARLSAAFDILRDLHARSERALVFIEHRRLQYRFVELAKREFSLERIDLINGNTPIGKRQAAVDRFQRNLRTGDGFDILVLGTRAAGTGLTLTAATHVIHVSRWWNPAVEEQCNDRVHRIGQEKPVTIHLPMAIHPEFREHSFDCLLHSLMNRKRRLANSALWPMGDTSPDVDELHRGMKANAVRTYDDPVVSAMAAMFDRDGKPMPPISKDLSLIFE